MLKEVDSAGQYTLWRCTDCAHVSKRGCDMSKHIEAKHIKTGGFNCSYCGKLCPSTNALRAHISRKHRESHSGAFDPMLKHFWNGHLFFVWWLNPVLNKVLDCKSFLHLDAALDLLALSHCAFEYDANGGKVWKCLDCGYVQKLKKDVQKHVEAKHLNVPQVKCNYCGKFYPNRYALRAHVSRKHRETHNGRFDLMNS